ncbi:EAL domain-containing protein [Lichenibacterium ramalinae]|nr:EAL domain-containing protein [Lichenibacterium ramalinae]
MTLPLDCLFLPTGTVLFSEGDPGDHAYLIQSGAIDILVEREGQEIVLARRGTGEIIGEMALLDHGTRSATARVSAPTEVIAITKRQLDQRISETDPVLRMCLGVVIERYRETLKMVRPDAVAPPPTTVRSLPGPAFDAAVAVLALEREIERGLLRAEFELFLQPIVALRDRRLAGFEALIRWNHPVRGLLAPAAFIPVAESSGLVVQITDRMLREAVSAVRVLLAARGAGEGCADEPLFVSVNVSGHDLVQPGFADGVMQILAEAALPPHHLKLEVTESMLMKDPARAGSILDTCRRHGMGIAVDDFGTGYSSLSHLSTLPITTLKIDRCFVQAMLGDPTSRKIVNTIRLLARELAIPIVAEGIEREAEAAALDAIGCEYGQGYLFGRPMPVTEAIVFLRAMPVPRIQALRAYA